MDMYRYVSANLASWLFGFVVGMLSCFTSAGDVVECRYRYGE